MMGKHILFTLLLSNIYQCSGQVSLSNIALIHGKYSVGFQHYLTFDSTRTYKRHFDWNNKSIPRPIQVSIWYPSTRIPDGNAINEKAIQNFEKSLELNPENQKAINRLKELRK